MKPRIIKVVDNECDTWQAKVEEGRVLMRLGRSYRGAFRPIDEVNFMRYATPESLRALAELLENPNEPGVPRIVIDGWGESYKVVEGRLLVNLNEWTDKNRWEPASKHGLVVTQKRVELWVDLFNNPTEDSE